MTRAWFERVSVPRWARRLALGAMAVPLLLACVAEDEASFRARPGPVPATPQRSGDPERGYEIVVDGRYMTCGMPYSAWRRVTNPPEPAETLPGRRESGLPYYMTLAENPRGVRIVNTNCLLCHAGRVDGKLIVGLGNESADFTEDPSRLVDAVGAFVSGEKEVDAWRTWAGRIAAIAPYMVTDTVGVNPAPNLTLALIAHRDPNTLEWAQAPLMAPPPEEPLPVSVPPWWRMAKKHAMFYNAMGRGDHARFMMMKSLVCTDSVDEAATIDQMFTDVREYIYSLEAPKYPFAIDETLAARGRTVFEEECSSCHGTYGPEGRYPNLVVDLESIGTDPAYALRAYEDSDRFMRWFNRSWYGDIAAARPAPGYIAPPLDGVWATAPFLHNGSVPTIEALLDSGTRPTYWARSFDSSDFDEDALGWRYRALEHGKQGARDREERKRIYDTTLHGYSNAGHTFGDDLTAEQRRALIEYLKAL